MKKIKYWFGCVGSLVLLLGCCFGFGFGIWSMPRHTYSRLEVQKDRQFEELGYYNHDIEYPLTDEDKQKLEEYDFYIFDWYWCLVICLGSCVVSVPSFGALVYCANKVID